MHFAVFLLHRERTLSLLAEINIFTRESTESFHLSVTQGSEPGTVCNGKRRRPLFNEGHGLSLAFLMGTLFTRKWEEKSRVAFQQSKNNGPSVGQEEN